jgi:hypothetical protein
MFFYSLQSETSADDFRSIIIDAANVSSFVCFVYYHICILPKSSMTINFFSHSQDQDSLSLGPLACRPAHVHENKSAAVYVCHDFMVLTSFFFY